MFDLLNKYGIYVILGVILPFVFGLLLLISKELAKRIVENDNKVKKIVDYSFKISAIFFGITIVIIVIGNIILLLKKLF